MAADQTLTGALELLERMTQDIRQQLNSAPANQRAALIAKFYPILTKATQEATVDDELSIMRDELTALAAETREAILTPYEARAELFAELPPEDA